VLPDTERYSDDYPQHFEAQTDWIVANREARRIACVLHLGDITQRNAPAEWAVARRCLGTLDGQVPYVLATGNHDYDDNAPKRDTTRLNEYFPLDAIRKWPTFGGAFEPGQLENSYHLVPIAGRDWIVLSLEMGPRDETVTWANRILERHVDRPAIIVTHAYLFRDNQRYDRRLGRQRASPMGWGNDGEELWQKLVRRHRNVMIVHSGHVSTGGLGYLASEGDYGNTVHQLMVDYEKMKGGGMAYLRLLEFLPDGKTVQVRSYSPALKTTRSSPLEEFTFELRAATRDEPEPVGEVRSAPLTRAPVHRYRFEGRSRRSDSIVDSAGEAHSTLRTEDSSSRLNGKGQLVLSGSGHVRLPPGILEEARDLSFEIWFTPTAEHYKWNSVVRFGSRDDWLTYVFRTLTVHRAEIAVDRHNEDIQQNVSVTPDEPLHVVVTYDHRGSDGAPLLCCYRDGQLAGMMTTRLLLSDVEVSEGLIGPFEGIFEELRIWDYSLQASEVCGSYEAGPGKLRIR